MNDKHTRIFMVSMIFFGILAIVAGVKLSNPAKDNNLENTTTTKPSAPISSEMKAELDFRKQSENDNQIEDWKVALRRLCSGSTNPYHKRAIELIEQNGLITQSQAKTQGLKIRFRNGLPIAPDTKALIVLVDPSSLTASRAGLTLIGQGKTAGLYNMDQRVVYLLNDTFDWFTKAVFLLHELVHLMEDQSGTAQAARQSVLWRMRSEEHAYRVTWDAAQFKTRGKYGELIFRLVQNNPLLNKEADPTQEELQQLGSLLEQQSLSNRMTLLLHKQFIATGQVWLKKKQLHATVKDIMRITRATHVFDHNNTEQAFELLDQLIIAEQRWRSHPPDRIGAAAIYEEVAKQDPHYATSWYRLTVHYAERMNQWMKENPGQAPIEKNKDLLKKLTHCSERFLSLRPDQVIAYQYYIQSLANEYRHEEAYQVIERGRTKFPHKKAVFDQLETRMREHQKQSGR